MSVFLPVDDRVRKVHFLKKITPSPGQVVRVEEYESDIYGDGPTAFIWDENLSAPSPDQDNRIASSVDTYGPGGANEGAWDILPPISPIDAGVVIAVPDGNQSRGLDTNNYPSTDETVNHAAQYVGNYGGGIVRLPSAVLPLDYGIVTVPSGVSLVVEDENALIKFDNTDSPFDATRPGVYFGQTTNGAAEIVLNEELEVNGLQVKIRRNGGNTLTISTETDATIDGSGQINAGSDGALNELIYDQPNDNWVVL